MKIGEREVSTKEFILAGILALVGLTVIWLIIHKGPPPKIGQPGMGLVQMQGGQPGPNPGQFAYPRGVAVNSQGDVFVADSRNNRIQKFAAKDWQFLTDFGGLFDEAKAANGDPKKLSTEALGKLHEPNGVAIGPDDMVYVIDTWNGRIEVYNSKGRPKFGFTTDDGFFGPREIVVAPNGICYVADTGKHRIVEFDKDGKKVRAWGMRGDKQGQFNEPIGLALDQAGNLYVADRLNFRIQVFNPDGQFVREWKVKGWSPEQVDMEPHLALDQARGLLYASDGRGKKVYCFKLDGTLAATLENNSNGAPLFQVPIGVAVDKDGNLYVTDAGAGRLLKLKGQF
jgi:tripartite motif-containing protein 71